MPRTCTICTHPQRAAIEAALVVGTSYRVIARQFGVGHDSVQRHADEHVKQQVAEQKEARDAAQALDVVQQLKTINWAALTVLKAARESGEHELVLKAIDRVHRQIETQAKLLGDLDERTRVEVNMGMGVMTHEEKQHLIRTIGDVLEELLPNDPSIRDRFTYKLLEIDAIESGDDARLQQVQKWAEDARRNGYDSFGSNGHN
jgi:hypothetical protein